MPSRDQPDIERGGQGDGGGALNPAIGAATSGWADVGIGDFNAVTGVYRLNRHMHVDGLGLRRELMTRMRRGDRTPRQDREDQKNRKL
jgi:hypothetical protein